MSLLTIPNVFANGTGPANLTDATTMNANFTAVATAVNNIYPSQILPLTSGQATFGATAVGVGYKFLANDATAVPLTITAAASQSANMFQVINGGAITTFVFDKNGIATFAAGGSASSNANVFINNDSAATNGFVFNVPTGSTNGFAFNVNGAIKAQISGTGFISAGAGTAFASLTGGDLSASRSTSTGVVRIGGAAASVGCDFNISNPNNLSFLNQASAYITLNAAAFTVTSDARLKADIAPLAESLPSILALKPSTYTLNSSGKRGLGFMAQDVQAVYPDLVSTDKDGMMGLTIDGLIAPCVAAIQELAAQFNAYVAAHP